MFAHCVPFPAPGPPSTKTTVGCVVAAETPPPAGDATGEEGASPTAPGAHDAALGANVTSVAAANPNAVGTRVALCPATVSRTASLATAARVSWTDAYVRQTVAACANATW